ncbi:MAG: TldD/PmbA family protein [Bacilli bacterium]|nr:TldD/PmbA family protein [Bacilli bacterium]
MANERINKFGISETNAKEILEIALATGGDFAEVYMDSTLNETIRAMSGKIDNISSSRVKGAAVRIIKDDMEVSASVTDCSVENLKKVAAKLAESINGDKTTEVLPFVEKEVKQVTKTITPRYDNYDFEVEAINNATKVVVEYSSEIVQVMVLVWKKIQEMFVFASDGTWQGDTRDNTRFVVQAIASDGKTMQNASSGWGMNQGMEMFDNIDIEAIAREAAHDAVEMLHAEDMVGGDIPVVINNGFGGVILHEACVHGLEATSVAKGQSVFCGKLGQKIASDIVNAVDTGVDENEWGSINVDDEGTPSQRTVLIENGILKSYLVDKRNSRIMNHPVTGSSRRESYKNQTTSRMRNTYFLNGTSTFEEIIAATKYGLFAKSMGGGSVNPATGEFNFAVNVGYLIEDGKITRPVKGATLVGSGKDVLLRIDMIANNLSCSQGMCGSLSGSIPTNVGQPTIRVSNMTVGGKGGKN